MTQQNLQVKTRTTQNTPKWQPPGDSNYLRVDHPSYKPFHSLPKRTLICGDALEALKLLPKNSVQTVITSPPYFSLRDYGTTSGLGHYDDLKSYIKNITQTFEELKQVLQNKGSVWLNMGDSYTSGNRKYRAPDKKNRARAMSTRAPTPEGLKPKDVIGVPWRLALALQEAGWYLRSEIIWYKPNAHPESVKDRPTKAHETIFLLSKEKDYYYDHNAIRGPRDRRLRSVWQIPTSPRKRPHKNLDDHPAMMPTSLASRCIAITSQPGDVVLDPYAGSGTTLLAAQNLERSWVGIEIKPSFVDLIERRLQNS